MTRILQKFSKSPKIGPFNLAPTLHVVNQDIVSTGRFIKTKFFPPNRFQGWIDYYLLRKKICFLQRLHFILSKIDFFLHMPNI